MSGIHELQAFLRDTGRYSGAIDGLYGPATRAAVVLGFTDGPDTPLTDQDFKDSSRRLACRESHIRAVAAVEANGSGFFNGEPKILFEPHRFSKLTQHRFDAQYPALSYPKWGTRPYPKTQDGRYRQLLDAIALDANAAFMAASYGKFQIMGENAPLCGYPGDAWRFAFAMARDEATQLEAFEKFLQAAGLATYLRAGMWTDFAKGYNGTAYWKNRYDVKLAQAAREWDRKAGLL